MHIRDRRIGQADIPRIGEHICIGDRIPGPDIAGRAGCFGQGHGGRGRLWRDRRIVLHHTQHTPFRRRSERRCIRYGRARIDIGLCQDIGRGEGCICTGSERSHIGRHDRGQRARARVRVCDREVCQGHIARIRDEIAIADRIANARTARDVCGFGEGGRRCRIGQADRGIIHGQCNRAATWLRIGHRIIGDIHARIKISLRDHIGRAELLRRPWREAHTCGRDGGERACAALRIRDRDIIERDIARILDVICVGDRVADLQT